MKTETRTIVLILMAGTLGACMFHGGDPKYVSTTTLGQELSDLKSALDSGAITEPEYRAMKEKIMNACPAKDHHYKPHEC